MEKKIRCKKCGSTLVYRRISTKELVCRKCGNVEKLNGNGLKNERRT